jgi:hypothetical protein
VTLELVSLISLIDFTDGCCITDIICACLSFIVLITTVGGLVSIDTDPNVVIGTLDNEITCSLGYPFDVTCLVDTTVAVSTDKGIEIISIDSTKTKRHIKTSKP